MENLINLIKDQFKPYILIKGLKKKRDYVDIFWILLILNQSISVPWSKDSYKN